MVWNIIKITLKVNALNNSGWGYHWVFPCAEQRCYQGSSTCQNGKVSKVTQYFIDWFCCFYQSIIFLFWENIFSNLRVFTLCTNLFINKFLIYIRLKERRNAAFELASLAATGEDAKNKIVENDGFETKFFCIFTFLFLHMILIYTKAC